MSRLRAVRWTWPRIALALLAALACYYVFVGIFVNSTGPKGERSSSYGTVSGGVSAWAELLERRGHEVVQGRESLAEHPPNPDSTLILIDGVPLRDAEVAAIRRFARRGGRVVLAGPGPLSLSSDLLGRQLDYRSQGSRVLLPVVRALETAGIGRVVGSGEGALTELGPATALMAGRRGVGVATVRAGRGRVLLVADASPLRNRFLASADNAVLAVYLAGSSSRPVQFVETIHGYGRQSGLSALPSRWKTAIALLALAGVIFLLARGKRFGPVERRDRDLPPPRSAYADALAATLEKTGDRAVAVEPIHAAARRQVAHRSGLGAEPGGEALRSAALQLGLSEDEAAALAADEDFDMIATGRALARLNGGTDK